jgi:AraC family transcriptional activator of pobA
MTRVPPIQQINDYLKAINVHVTKPLNDFLVIDYGNLNLEHAVWLNTFRLGCFEVNLDLTPGCPIRVDSFELLSVANRLSLISPYRLQTTLSTAAPVKKELPHKGYGIFFSPGFMYGNFADQHLAKDLPFFSPFNTPTIYLNQATVGLFIDIIHKIQHEQDHFGAVSQEIIKSYLNILFLKAKQHYQNSDTIYALNRDAEIFYAFDNLVQKHFKELNTVKQYAGIMHISGKHLSETVKKVSGASALQHIHKTQLNYASAQLLHTGKTVSEIAYELNFENPDYFSVFFKRLTGKSPLQFRSL